MDWNNEAKWKAAIDENLRMGYIELMILHLLSERDMYGYEIKREIAERTDGTVTFGEGSLYVPLLRMAKRGLVSSEKVVVVGKRFRTYYHIEEFGREYLAYGESQRRALFDAMTNFFERKPTEKPKKAARKSAQKD